MLCLKAVASRLLPLLVAAVTGASAQAELSVVTYNLKGNGVANWGTNASQVRAIARQLIYLNPDIICLNEIPDDFTWQMTNWQNAFFPDYAIVVSPNSDGYIHNAVASRYPILSTHSYFNMFNLSSYGYNGTFTRDLFEAQIDVPDFPQPLHVLVAHLKSGTSSSDDAARRGAEASVISNFCVARFVNPAASTVLHPYFLAGDMNEDIDHPATGSKQPIQRLTSNTGLKLTTPVNPVTSSPLTISIQSSLTRRFDYILPCGLLFSNIQSSQVFRTDVLNPLPPGINSNDDSVASDHLPVMMVFSNPYDVPFAFTSVSLDNQVLSLSFESVPGQYYSLETSSNLVDWATFADNLLATNSTVTFTTNSVEELQFLRARISP